MKLAFVLAAAVLAAGQAHAQSRSTFRSGSSTSLSTYGSRSYSNSYSYESQTYEMRGAYSRSMTKPLPEVARDSSCGSAGFEVVNPERAEPRCTSHR